MEVRESRRGLGLEQRQVAQPRLDDRMIDRVVGLRGSVLDDRAQQRIEPAQLGEDRRGERVTRLAAMGRLRQARGRVAERGGDEPDQGAAQQEADGQSRRALDVGVPMPGPPARPREGAIRALDSGQEVDPPAAAIAPDSVVLPVRRRPALGWR